MSSKNSGQPSKDLKPHDDILHRIKGRRHALYLDLQRVQAREAEFRRELLRVKSALRETLDKGFAIQGAMAVLDEFEFDGEDLEARPPMEV
jgi:hypothetical protein